MELNTKYDENNGAQVFLTGEFTDEEADGFTGYLDEVLKKTTNLTLDLSGMEDLSENGLYAILNLRTMMPEEGRLDITGGGEEMESILEQVGFEHPDEGFYVLMESSLPEKNLEEILEKLPEYCREAAGRIEGHVDAAVDENGEEKGHIIYIEDHYKNEAVVEWVTGEEPETEFFMLQGLWRKMTGEGIERVHINLKDALDESNNSFYDEDSLWYIIINREREKNGR